jgi:hypothetical protein
VTITAVDVQHQTSYLVGKVVLVLLIGAVIDELFLHRPFTPANWGAVLAYLVWKASTPRAGRARCVVDHVRALASGGVDAPPNMQ